MYIIYNNNNNISIKQCYNCSELVAFRKLYSKKNYLGQVPVRCIHTNSSALVP